MGNFVTTFFRNMCGKWVFWKFSSDFYTFYGGNLAKKGVFLGVFWVFFGCFLGVLPPLFTNKFDEVFLCHHFLLISLTKNGLFWGIFGVKSLIFVYF